MREAPFTDIHLENMLKLSRMGVVISPPVPAFYNRPKSIEEIVDHTVARLLDLFGIEVGAADRWNGKLAIGASEPPAGKRAGTTRPKLSPRNHRPASKPKK